ncbi:MAG: hypothetical protein D6732_08335 [Methanobacteriota archaeon]|nr:MAG: hypothetical protein D6732_08335 [Euryarchaeota archaeon]
MRKNIVFVEKALETSQIVKSPVMGKLVWKSLAFPRYYFELISGYIGFLRYGKQYQYRQIVIFGLPKSGTTWIEKALALFPGFQSISVMPWVQLAALRGASKGIDIAERKVLNYQIPATFFSRHHNKLLVVKIHSALSPYHADLLRQNNLKYLIVYRDIRDVAVSYVHFVRSRPWHPLHEKFSAVNFEEGLIRFAQVIAPLYLDWIEQSLTNLDEHGMVITYEEMKNDFSVVFRKVCQHFSLPAMNVRRVENILASSAYKGVTHFRKGIIGEWEEVFSDDVKKSFQDSVERMGRLNEILNKHPEGMA